MKMKTPELEKIHTNRDESQKIGQFLDWLRNEREIALCELAEYSEYNTSSDPDVYCPATKTIEQWLAEYFDIDLDKAEKERQSLLDELGARNNAKR